MYFAVKYIFPNMIHDVPKQVAEINNKQRYCWHTMARLYEYFDGQFYDSIMPVI